MHARPCSGRDVLYYFRNTATDHSTILYFSIFILKPCFSVSAHAQEVYDIKAAADSSGLQSSCICRHETGINAVMNCASFYDGRHHQLATGEDELCRTYSVKYKVIT